MYVGNVLIFIGLGGLAAGPWNALAIGSLGHMLCSLMAGMEKGK